MIIIARKVEVVPFCEQWATMFAKEAEKLKQVFGKECLRIDHIGSTAIPEMSAKPIIDILLEVHHIDHVDQYHKAMAELGYQAMGENGIPQRRFFQKGGDERTHHVHVFPAGSEHIVRHIALKEYMIAHPEEAKAYSRLKIALAKRFPNDIQAYIKGKEAFVRETEKKALAWYRQKQRR
ncbi:GrpB family protein [Parageobacillus thermoglucosidasius]|uniref:GrpB family protein n=1 Tax=Parageobacillus thermoglucosidasius TaxID=1426 RepID=UPI000E15B7E4|nr:GrpB family protein [Parageobacillus thermoglucosidasius]RDE23656.1 GrpB family protein [Parageobacillus thermoglucosidasius]